MSMKGLTDRLYVTQHSLESLSLKVSVLAGALISWTPP